jgi:hypothetical protein
MRKFTAIALTGLLFTLSSPWAAAIGDVTRDVTRGGINYVSGGVGVDSEEQMLAQQKNFDLKLMFTLVEGNYLADVNVVVADAKGRKVIEDVADGPFFMAKLPDGQYTVTATYEGTSQTRKVNVSAGHLNTVHLRWPKNPETDFVVSGKR